ncbi:hypothetical protein EZV62_009111 [Acer yangbiense]|uniref:Uncharacterized protein n=1 Tax=Acer yangbiense TaxID=1000413 RepID=A0A5C7IHB4_9ROSI|nr:hypothetical protein EZV62_009111 [Acer yangbiense]
MELSQFTKLSQTYGIKISVVITYFTHNKIDHKANSIHFVSFPVDESDEIFVKELIEQTNASSDTDDHDNLSWAAEIYGDQTGLLLCLCCDIVELSIYILKLLVMLVSFSMITNSPTKEQMVQYDDLRACFKNMHALRKNKSMKLYL